MIIPNNSNIHIYDENDQFGERVFKFIKMIELEYDNTIIKNYLIEWYNVANELCKTEDFKVGRCMPNKPKELIWFNINYLIKHNKELKKKVKIKFDELI